MKKTLSLILALLMSVSCASFVFADDAAIADTAVVAEEESQYAEAIEFLGAYGIYKGYGEGKLGANDDIQRYQMALFTSRIVTGWVDDAAWDTGIWNASYTEFTDVNEAPASNYLGAISYANQNGIIEGYGDGRFGPTDGITYQNALTMVVRALGYQNLSWPWGYIEKAINLGLTAGITDVAYTDVLTRGEVAQVIYNALFATTKDGTTLAAKSFGIEFGWETVIITASDRAFYSENGKASEAGIVAYKVVGTDGTLSSDTYYTKASTFGLTGHEDDLSVGKAFRVCFGVDGMLAAKSLWTETIWNLGTSSKDADGKYPIQAYLSAYTAVSKYTETTYIKSNGAIAYDHEIIIKEATYGSTTVAVETDYKKYAIDWTNGNILVADTVDKDGKVLTYTVAWYYNELLDQYYALKTNKTVDGEVEIVGIDIMDSKDVDNLIKDINVKLDKDVNVFKTIGKPATSAYASLELYDLNNNGEAEYGLYTSYRLGYLSTYTDKDHDSKRTFIKVSNLAKKVADTTYTTITGKDDPVSYDCKGIIHGQCNDCEKAGNDIWWTDDFAPATNSDGEIKNAFVLYNYNKVTGELRVLKTIGSNTASGTYVATGVLRSYNVDKMTVNIDGTNYSFKYDELEGNMFPTKDEVTKNNAARAVTSAHLRSLFNQYVTYVVVDGTVVYAARRGATNTNYIIIESYAGLSNDGYIVVNGYATDDLKLKQYRIGSYNGWQQGDYFYYLNREAVEDSFTRGALYQIRSYDKTNDVYYVNLAGEFEDDGTYNVNQISKSKFSFTVDTDGYITVVKNDKAQEERKMDSADKWIILGEKDGTSNGFAPMCVYTGKVPADWKVEGYRVDLGKESVYFIVNADMTKVKGFDWDVYANSYVVFLRDALNSATYDQYGTEDDPWYLLGASTYDVIVFDLLDGTEKTVTAQNVYLKQTYIYRTIDGKIMSDERVKNINEVFGLGYTGGNVVAYEDANAFKYIATADYLVGYVDDVTNYLGKDKKDKFSEFITKKSDDHETLNFDKAHKGYCSDVTVILLEGKINGENALDRVTSYTKIGDADAYAKYCKSDEYTAIYVYDVDTQKVVIYISELFCKNTTTTDFTAHSTNAAQVVTDAYIGASVTGTKTTVTTTKYGEKTNVDTYAVKEMEIYFTGKKVDTDTHHALWSVSNEGGEYLYFGVESDCWTEDWDVKVTTTVTTEEGPTTTTYPIYGSRDIKTYTNHEDEEHCDLIKSIGFTFDKAIAVTKTETNVEVTFTSADPAAVTYTVKGTIKLDGGKVVLELSSVNGYDVTFANPNAKA